METPLIEKALKLQEQVDYHDHLFFVLNESEISDSEYDLLKLELVSLLEDNPDLVKELEALQDNNRAVSIFEQKNPLKLVDHPRPFISLRRTYDFNQYSFYKKVYKESYIEVKLDGLAIELVYHYGRLVHVLTKGTHTKGEDVSHNSKLFKSLPQELNEFKDLPVADIRCEAHLTFYDIEDMKANGVKIEKQRNQVSGWIRSAEPTRHAKGRITLSAYEISPNASDALKFTTGKQVRNWLQEKGFDVPELVTEKDLLSQTRNKNAPFDGWVVKANQLNYHARVDSNQEKAPFSSIAFKYNTLFGDTTAHDVTWSVNKNQIVPKLTYEEINIDGSKCTQANLFNAGNFLRLKLGHGDKVRIVMSGDCVPHLHAVIEASTDPRFSLPTECPCCKGPVSRIGPSLVCNDTEGCTDKLLSTLKRACGKEGLDIQGLGPNTLEEWIGQGLIKRPLDLFGLSSTEIPARHYNAIQAARKMTLGQFIYVLNMSEFGKIESTKLSYKLGSVENFLSFIKDPERVKEGLSPAKALSLLKHASNKEEMRYIERFAAAATIRPDTQRPELVRVVLTGVFDSPRNVIAELLLKSGVEVVPRVTKLVKCVIVGSTVDDTETNSMKEARKLGVPMLFVNRDTEFNQIVKEIKTL